MTTLATLCACGHERELHPKQGPCVHPSTTEPGGCACDGWEGPRCHFNIWGGPYEPNGRCRRPVREWGKRCYQHGGRRKKEAAPRDAGRGAAEAREEPESRS